MSSTLCHTHPERPAPFTCERCGAFLCSDCRLPGFRSECAPCHAREGALGEVELGGALNDAGLLLLRRPWVVIAITLRTSLGVIAGTAAPWAFDHGWLGGGWSVALYQLADVVAVLLAPTVLGWATLVLGARAGFERAQTGRAWTLLKAEPELTLLAVLSILALAAGAVLCVLPSVAVAGLLTVVFPAVLLGGRHLPSALTQAFSLLRSRPAVLLWGALVGWAPELLCGLAQVIVTGLTQLVTTSHPGGQQLAIDPAWATNWLLRVDGLQTALAVGRGLAEAWLVAVQVALYAELLRHAPRRLLRDERLRG